MTANQTKNDDVFNKRIHADDRLDMLYMRQMRCPYCHTKIPRGTSKCKNCSLTKEQIYYAKLTMPYKPGQNILYSKVRPESLPLWKMGLGGAFGFLGVHCFLAKRYLRGIIIVLLLAAYVASVIIFPPAFGDAEPNATRYLFESNTYPFPGDLLGLVALVMWVWDLFAIFFGQFKYPVVVDLGEEA